MAKRKVDGSEAPPLSSEEAASVLGFVAVVGKLLRQARKMQDLTKESAYALSGVSTNTIYRIEKGASNVTWQKIVQLASAYGLDEQELLLRAYREHFRDE